MDIQGEVLYKYSSKMKLQVWSCYTEGADVITKHGEFYSENMQLSKVTAVPKNIGKVNETTAEEQALIECVAAYKGQRTNKHYRDTVEEAQEVVAACRIPRKLHNYKDHGYKIKYPAYVSIKMNGSRACVIEGDLYSKIGRLEEVKVTHIKQALEKLNSLSPCFLDSEVYAHGVSLQRIRSAWLKPYRTDKEKIKLQAKLAVEGRESYDPDKDTQALQLHVFDIPVESVPFKVRIEKMKTLELAVMALGLEDVIKINYPTLVNCEADMLRLREKAVLMGYEGVVIYEEDDMMHFNSKSYSTQKSKPRLDAEGYVTEVLVDKKGNGKLKIRASDALGNATFGCVMKVGRRDNKTYPKDFESLKKECLGRWITFSYEELSEKGVPTKPVGECIRACDATGQPLE